LDFFHRIFGSLTDYPIESNTGTFGLLGRHALPPSGRLCRAPPLFPGLRAWIGFNTADVLYDREAAPPANRRQSPRVASSATPATGVFGFSYLPLRTSSPTSAAASADSASPWRCLLGHAAACSGIGIIAQVGCTHPRRDA